MSERETFETGPSQPWVKADWSRRYGWLHTWTIILVTSSGLGGALMSLGILHGVVQIIWGNQHDLPLVLVFMYLSGVALGSALLWLLPFDLQSRLARRAYFKGKVWTEDARIKTWRTLAHWNPLFAPFCFFYALNLWIRHGNERTLSWLKGEW
jgi:hypothetical protein